ncbi:MAG: hypothetical protein U0527_08250 [Candidatus Eisenbacteria bacterium]
MAAAVEVATAVAVVDAGDEVVTAVAVATVAAVDAGGRDDYGDQRY